MDLLNQLAKKINAMPELPTKISKAAINTEYQFGIYTLPGSKVIEEDMAGNQEKSIPIEIAYRSNDYTKATNMLTQVSDMLNNLAQLDTDGSYTFNQLDIEPQPYATGLMINDEGVFLLDFSVIITTKKERIYD
ncbi:minor capsid protein [uncultured Weissella sp.]|uniref:phage tail terminator protein n=1 Tax=uncultured Weissella sp. TaxID=253243 RepID=UPI0027DDDB2D|nr:minor capsid protein [uncultured Weissella sp.]